MDSSNLVLNKFALPNGLFSDVSIVSTDEKCKSLELHYLVGFDLGALNARFDVSLFSLELPARNNGSRIIEEKILVIEQSVNKCLPLIVRTELSKLSSSSQVAIIEKSSNRKVSN